jgi:poly(A) polymerase
MCKQSLIIETINNAGGEARLVGGCVRNKLMNLPISDIDIATTLPPVRVGEVLESHGFKIIPTGIEHGTVTAVKNRHSFEITTLRRDVSTDGRRAIVAFTDNWQEDAARRDFTINALYEDVNGKIYDYFNGLDDIRDKIVRFIGNPEERIKEDFLRIMRFFRFYSNYGGDKIDASGLKACKELKEGLRKISAERIRDELFKILSSNRAIHTLCIMQNAGILDVVFPEARNLSAMPEFADIKSGFRDKSIHDAARLLCILSDSAIGDAHGNARGNAKVAGHLKLSSRQASFITTTLKKYQQYSPDINESMSFEGAALNKLIYRIGGDSFYAICLMQYMHGIITQAKLDAVQAFLGDYTTPIFPIGGDDLKAKGFQNGPTIGATLKSLEKKWIESGFQLSKESLLSSIPQ